MASTRISGGFDIEGDVADAIEHDDRTPEEDLAYRVISQLRQEHPKAAAAAAIELVRRISRAHDLGIAVIE